jgi:hypothetical protein
MLGSSPENFGYSASGSENTSFEKSSSERAARSFLKAMNRVLRRQSFSIYLIDSSGVVTTSPAARNMKSLDSKE